MIALTEGIVLPHRWSKSNMDCTAFNCIPYTRAVVMLVNRVVDVLLEAPDSSGGVWKSESEEDSAGAGVGAGAAAPAVETGALKIYSRKY